MWRTTLAEMSRLTSDPLALIVETTPELIVRQEMILKSIGLAVESLRSVSELEHRVARGGDIRLILSQAALYDARPITMVDRIRRLANGAEIPILFYGEEENVLGTEIWDVPTLQIPQPRSAATIGALFQSWYQPAALPPLVTSERTYYRSLATSFFEAK
jgi:hypothetical protein